MAKPHPDWIAQQWAKKEAWHVSQRALPMRQKVAAVIRLQHRQQSLNASKGLPMTATKVWKTKP